MGGLVKPLNRADARGSLPPVSSIDCKMSTIYVYCLFDPIRAIPTRPHSNREYNVGICGKFGSPQGDGDIVLVPMLSKLTTGQILGEDGGVTWCFDRF